ncbi:hypothetical protein NDN08_006114 [Rhodosorus marinus]|uniref:Prefoldin subunit 5 n=1 Tax=Rhodosorus marinus TaxID=101924 RepID=A0AAV8UJV1_9RHOD|nr:hypothetical protein NDN08_006114 [Rhodosorus marinus]
MESQEGTLPLGSLNIEQLQNVQKSTEQEVQSLTEQLTQLTTAQQRILSSKRLAKEFGKQPEGKEILLPLSGSVYVQGKLCDTSTAMVDLGTGYYALKTLEEAEEYFQRRAAVIKDNVDKGTQALVQRRQMYEAVTSVLQQKMAAAQRQGAS